jgi:RHS repeat-associated protein
LSENYLLGHPFMSSLKKTDAKGGSVAGAQSTGVVAEVTRLIFSLFVLLCLGLSWVQAAEREFTLAGKQVRLQDVSGEVGVHYQAMRFNRAALTWNVEVIITNKSTRTLEGPFVLLIDSYSGTTGPLQPDGLESSAPAKAFYDLTAKVGGEGLQPGTASTPRTLSLGFVTNAVPRLVTRVYVKPAPVRYALGLVRTLNEVGQPLPGVEVTETGPEGQRTNFTDLAYGVVSLGQGPGAHTWRFSAPGYLPVWRWQTLNADAVAVLTNPRLSLGAINRVIVTQAGGGQLTDRLGTIHISFGPGSFSQETVAVVTPLTGQTLPVLLPLGWSPVLAFWLETMGQVSGLPIEPIAAANATLRPWGPLGLGEAVALVRLNQANLQWEVRQVLSGNGTNSLTAMVQGSGAYALVVGDAGPIAPPPAKVGQALPASSVGLPDYAGLRASGKVEPPVRVASRVPELVTATAEVTITNASGAMPSGLVLRCEVREQYRLSDGRRRLPPQYENFIIGYQRPGDGSGATLQANFPLRPLLLLGADELVEATVTVDVLTPTVFSDGVIEATGGEVTKDGVRVIAVAGDIIGPQAVQIRRLDTNDFVEMATGGAEVVRAFDLTVGGVAPGRRLRVQFDSLPANGTFVLARVLAEKCLYGAQPLERLASDSSGRLSSLEPASGEKLSGLTGAGQYLLLRVSGPQGLVTGVARNSVGQPGDGLPVRITGQPWLTFSATDGSYRLVAPTGSVEVAATDLATGDIGQVNVSVASPQTVAKADVSAAPSGPQVTGVTPAPGATAVARVTSITVQFSEPINPGSLGAKGIELLGTNGQPVAASLTLNLRNTAATLLPTAQLAPSTLHTIRLSTNIADLTGLRLVGTNAFAFTTASDFLSRAGAQVISHEPANGLARMVGTPGIAEPESPVILVNETTGATATVLSKLDGSFDNFIEGSVDDFLSAVIVNKNGTRNTIPVSRQLFRDGSVGLFNGGGILEAQSDGGPVQVIVEPGAIPGKSKFKLETLSMLELLTLVKATQPENGQLLGGLKLTLDGDELREAPKLSMPVAESTLNLNPGERAEDRLYALCEPIQADGVTVYNVVDTMQYEAGKLVTHSPPFPGMGFTGIFVSTIMPIGMSQKLTVVGEVVAALGSLLGQDGLTDEEYTQGKANGTVWPVPGAIISLYSEATGVSTRPGLHAGAFVARANTFGFFAMQVPFNAYEGNGFVLRAHSQRYPRIYGAKNIRVPTVFDSAFPLSGGRVVLPIPESALPGVDKTPPRVSVSAYGPVLPIRMDIPFLFVLQDDRSTPRISAAEVDLTRSFRLPGGQFLRTEDVTKKELSGSGQLSPTVVTQGVTLNLTNAARVFLTIAAEDDKGNTNLTPFVFYFGVPPPALTNAITSSNPNDTNGPQVVAHFPASGVTVSDLEYAQITFNEAMDVGITNMSSGSGSSSAITVTSTGNLVPNGFCLISQDQQQIKVYPGQLEPGQEYTITINSQAKDINGNELDQDPSTVTKEPFTLVFKTPPVQQRNLSQVDRPAASVIWGDYSFTADRKKDGTGALVVHRLDPAIATVIVTNLPPFPRTLTLVPDYSFRIRPESSGADVSLNRVLLIVTGGLVGGASDNSGLMTGMGQWMWVIDITKPEQPVRIASEIISIDPTTAVGAVRWSPPNLGILMQTPEGSLINLVNLQAFILGANYTKDDRKEVHGETLTGPYTPGEDKNGDGDYIDDGEVLPKANTSGVFGLEEVYPTASGRLIVDFDIGSGGTALVALMPEHKNPAFPPRFQTMFYGGVMIGLGTNDFGKMEFSNLRMARLLLDEQFPIQTAQGTQNTPVALVATTKWIVLLDLTTPEFPVPLSTNTIAIDDLTIYGLQRTGPDEYAVGASKGIYFLRRSLMLLPGQQGNVHPAVVKFLPVPSLSRTFGVSAAHVVAPNLGGLQMSFRAPVFSVVKAPLYPVQDITDLITWEEPRKRKFIIETEKDLVIGPCRLIDTGGPCPPGYDPPSPWQHYYVLLDAWGGIGSTIKVAVESIDANGRLISAKGRLFPPIILTDQASSLELNEAQPTVNAVTAHRMSDEPGSPLYNVFLSDPLIVVREPMSPDQLQRLNNAPGRKAIWSGHALRLSLDANSSSSAPSYSDWVSKLSGTEYQPGLSAVFLTVPGEYIDTPNPSFVSAAPRVAGVDMQAGEFGLSETDVFVEGRHQDLVLTRVYQSRSRYHGALGRGWDFNLNARIFELKPGLLPAGFELCPAHFYDDNTLDKKILPGDALFINGLGAVQHFRKIGPLHTNENNLSLYSSDPALQEFRWINRIAAYYESPPGEFSVLYKFQDGAFVLVAPNAARTYFRADGKLDRSVGTYPDSQITCRYGRDRKLRKVIGDRGVELEFGYYGRSTSPDFGSLDKPYDKVVHIGLLARIKAGADEVKYEYDDEGALEKMTNPAGKVTTYGFDSTDKFLLTLAGRDDGTKMPAQRVTYTGGLVEKITQQSQDVKFSGAKATAKERYATASADVKVTIGSNPSAEFTVDKRGRPTQFANREIKADDGGLLTKVADVSDQMEMRHDTNNSVYRFRGNLLGTEHPSKPDFKTGFSYDGTAFNRLSARTNTEGVATIYVYTYGTYVSQIEEKTGPVKRTALMNNFGQITEETREEGNIKFRRAPIYDSSSYLQNGEIIGSGSDTLPQFTATQTSGSSPGGSGSSGTLSFQANTDGQLETITASGLPSINLGYNEGRVETEEVVGASGSLKNRIFYHTMDKEKVKQVISKETGLPDSTTTYTYNQGRIDSITTDGEVTTYSYDGVLLTGVTGPGRKRSVEYTDGKVTKVTEQGVEADLTYDTQGRVETITQQGAVTEFAYNQGNQLKSKTIKEGDITLLSESYSYDAAGRIKSVTAGGVTRDFEYFPDGMVRKTKIGQTTLRELDRDAAGRVKFIDLPGFIKYEYNNPDASSGQFTTEIMILAGGVITKTRAFDAKGRIKEVTWPAGTWKYSYDEFGNPESKTDPDNVVVKHQHAPGGLILSTTFSDGKTVNFTYVTGRHLESIGNQSFVLDADKLTKKINYPDGTYTEFIDRNAFFEPKTVRHGGLTQTHTWTDGRLTRIDAGADRQEFKCDGLGRRKAAILNDIRVEFGYDTKGQFNSETSSGPGFASRSWSASFNDRNYLLSETYPSGLVINWGGANGLPTAAQAIGISSITWHGPGLLETVSFTSGLKISRSYDGSLRKTAVKYELSSGQVLAGFEYGLTAGGRVLWEKRLHENAYDVYTRNAASKGMRITGFKFSAQTSTGANPFSENSGFDFDDNGEISAPTSMTAGDERAFHAPITVDSYSRVTQAAGVSVSYNDQGSTVQTPVWLRLPGDSSLTQETASLFYDGLGMLRHLERGSGFNKVTVEYRRDGLGRIVERTVTGPTDRCVPGVRQYVWKGRQLIEEYEKAGADFLLVRRYVYVGDDLVLMQAAATPGAALQDYIPLVNINGSICGYLNSAGFLVERILYGGYGTPVFLPIIGGVPQGPADRSVIGSTLLFHGAFYEAEFGLYQMGQRTLHPQLGRFLQRDNQLYVESKAMFTAFNGDPVGRIDPSGSSSISLETLQNAKEQAGDLQEKANAFLKALTDVRNNEKREETVLSSSGLDLLGSGLSFASIFGQEEFKEFAQNTTSGIDSLKLGLEVVQIGLDMRRDRMLLTAIKAHALAPTHFSSRMKWLNVGGAAADFDLLDGHFWNSEELKKARQFRGNSGKAVSAYLQHKGSYLEQRRANWFKLAEKGSTMLLDLYSKSAQGSDTLAPPNETLVKMSEGLLKLKDNYAKYLEDKELSGMQFSFSKAGFNASVKGLWANKDAIQAAFEMGMNIGKQAVVLLSDEVVGQAYSQAVKEYEQNGGALTVVAGILSHFNFDRTANLIRNYAEFDVASQFLAPMLEAISGNDPKTQHYLRGLDAP